MLWWVAVLCHLNILCLVKPLGKNSKPRWPETFMPNVYAEKMVTAEIRKVIGTTIMGMMLTSSKASTGCSAYAENGVGLSERWCILCTYLNIFFQCSKRCVQ